jgi:hypothetical protein
MIFKSYSVSFKSIENGVEVTWPRFYRKWEKTSDGSYINFGITYTSVLEKERISIEPLRLIVSNAY